MNEPKTGTSLPSRKNLSNCGSAAYGSRMRFKVLGPLEVTGPNGPISLGGPKQRAVLAHLLVRTNELDAFRFDTSDLIYPSRSARMPPGGAMLTYLDEGPGSVDRILEDIEASWPDG